MKKAGRRGARSSMLGARAADRSPLSRFLSAGKMLKKLHVFLWKRPTLIKSIA
jgi:hypothetical protein